jgi:hypothetical protein
MKYINILKAQKTMQYIMKLRLPIRENKKSRAIYKMVLDIEELASYIQLEERKIIEKYQGVVQPNGTINFGDDSDGALKAQACVAEIAEFENFEAEWNHEVIKLSEESLVDDGGFTLSPEEIFYLEGFVEFED